MSQTKNDKKDDKKKLSAAQIKAIKGAKDKVVNNNQTVRK
jgi:hypothetical protein